jgi:hypothetical protein
MIIFDANKKKCFLRVFRAKLAGNFKQIERKFLIIQSHFLED